MAKVRGARGKASTRAGKAEAGARKPPAKAGKATASKASRAAAAGDPSKDGQILAALRARYAPVSAEDAAGIATFIDDAQRAALGARTRGKGVLRDGVANAVAIDAAIQLYPAAVAEHYEAVRLSYLLGCLDVLRERLDASTGRASGQTGARLDLDTRLTAARAARSTLVGKLRRCASKRPEDRAELSAALGSVAHADDVAQSVTSLAALATKWLARADAAAVVRARVVGLTKDVVDAALAASAALADAATTKGLAGQGRAIDSPDVNVAEGDVLHELEDAFDAFDAIHEAHPSVGKLIAGPNTRAILSVRRRPPEEPPPAPPAANEAGG